MNEFDLKHIKNPELCELIGKFLEIQKQLLKLSQENAPEEERFSFFGTLVFIHARDEERGILEVATGNAVSVFDAAKLTEHVARTSYALSKYVTSQMTEGE